MRVEVVQGNDDGRRQLAVAAHAAEGVGHEGMGRDDDARTVLLRLVGERARRNEPERSAEPSRRRRSSA